MDSVAVQHCPCKRLTAHNRTNAALPIQKAETANNRTNAELANEHSDATTHYPANLQTEIEGKSRE